MSYKDDFETHKNLSHKKKGLGCCRYLSQIIVFSLKKPDKRNELIMIPIPKPKFFERKVPAGKTEDEYFTEIMTRQTHILRDAIDRVSSLNIFNI